MKDDLKTLISPALTRCIEAGNNNLNTQILNGDIDISLVASVYKITEQQVLELARYHRF